LLIENDKVKLEYFKRLWLHHLNICRHY